MSEDRYEPYQYGAPEEPQQEVEAEVVGTEPVETENAEPKFEEVEFVEPEFVEPKFEETEFVEPESIETEPKETQTYDYNYNYSQYSQQPQEPRGGKKSNGFLKALGIVGLAVVFGVVASVVFKGTNYVIDRYLGGIIAGDTTETSGENDEETTQEIGATQIVTSTGTVVESSIADVAESVMPSVVSITNMSIQEVQNYFFGGTQQYESESSGSGIIVGQNDTELLIATNNHVVEGSETLTVAFIDGSSANAQIKGTDSDIDLAIIAISLSDLESSTMEQIKVATLGDSDAMRVGETTIAIGNALGYGQSVTAGIASALGTTIDGYEGKLIQTDAAINPGNSGGALLNAAGEVIGINTAKVSDESVEGMGYAIPISDVLDVLQEMMNKETRTKVAESERGVIGIEVIDVTSQMSEYYGIPQGVYVNKIVQGGAADEADLPLYSVIVGIDGYAIDSWSDLQDQLQYYKAGDKVKLTVMVQNRKGYEEEIVEVTLQAAE